MAGLSARDFEIIDMAGIARNVLMDTIAFAAGMGFGIFIFADSLITRVVEVFNTFVKISVSAIQKRKG